MGEREGVKIGWSSSLSSQITLSMPAKRAGGGGEGETQKGSPPAVLRDGLKKWSRGPTRHKGDNINREGSP
jgi:hypothetical protein